MVFSSIGNLSAKSVETTVARYLNDIKSSARDFSRRQPAAVEPFTRAVAKHNAPDAITGARAQGDQRRERLPLALLGQSARRLLGQLHAERAGAGEKLPPADNIEASYTPYSDSGIVAIYFYRDHDNTDHCIELIEGEMDGSATRRSRPGGSR